jgi:two-component system cell cycle response regulator CtrA
MTKPFHKDELVARIHTIVRRSRGHAQSTIQTGDLIVNLDTKTVEVTGARVHLTVKEYQKCWSSYAYAREPSSPRKSFSINSMAAWTNLSPRSSTSSYASCARSSPMLLAAGTVWGRGHVLRDPTPAAMAVA